jgi:hypothetical protein
MNIEREKKKKLEKDKSRFQETQVPNILSNTNKLVENLIWHLQHDYSANFTSRSVTQVLGFQ